MNIYAGVRTKVATLGAQFTEPEAWSLFRLAAFGEAIGWTLLISGICLSRFVLNGNHDPISIAGQFHGLLFMVYLAAVTVLAASMGWGWRKVSIALAFSIPPFGTLIFEKWAAITRRLQQSHDWRQVSVWAIILKGDQILAVQPAAALSWELPGGSIQRSIDSKQALGDIIKQQLGIEAQVGELEYIVEGTSGKQPTLDLYFRITNNKAFASSKQSSNPNVDEIRYIDPKTTPDLVPNFLQSIDFQSVKQAKFIKK